MERILFEEIKPFVRRVKKVKTEEIKAGYDMCSYANLFIYVLSGRLCLNAGEPKYRELAEKHVESFIDRINKKSYVEHHDMVFCIRFRAFQIIN